MSSYWYHGINDLDDLLLMTIMCGGMLFLFGIAILSAFGVIGKH